MKKIIVALVIVLVMGGAGFLAAKFTAPPPKDPEAIAAARAAEEQAAKERLMLLKVPLGKFTVQVIRGVHISHLLFDIDMFLSGVAEFERLNGAMGRALMRDGVIKAVSELAEMELWAGGGELVEIDKVWLAEQIVLRVNETVPAARAARINSLVAGPFTRQ